ncbi:MAG: hypothetical protein ACI9WU_002252 [Myxococcota bacterium]|jgi:hypothetical protein
MGGHGQGHSRDTSLRTILMVLGVGAVFYLIGFAFRPAPVEAQNERPSAGPGYTEPLPSVGPDDAPVIMVEVADYKCRFCRIRNGLMKRIMTEHREDVQFVFKHFPFVASDSRRGAVGSMAANRQNAFWEYSDLLYRAQSDPWTDGNLTALAGKLGLDTDKFAADLADPKLAAYVAKDEAAAQHLAIRATPTLLINGRIVPNDANADTVRMMVRDAVAEVQGILKRGEATTVQQARAIAAARHHPMGSEFSRVYLNNDVSNL